MFKVSSDRTHLRSALYVSESNFGIPKRFQIHLSLLKYQKHQGCTDSVPFDIKKKKIVDKVVCSRFLLIGLTLAFCIVR
jgi:hypothetical protein